MHRSARWWKVGPVVLVLLGAVAASRLLWPRPSPPPPPGPVSKISGVLVSQPVPVSPGIYLLGRCNPAAVYAVDTTDGIVLIDSGMEADAGDVVEQFAHLKLDIGRLRAILLTHGHADHSLGAEHLRKRTGAKVYAGRGDCVPLREGGPREAFFSTYYTPGVTAHPTTVDVELAGGETLEFGETRFHVLATPGHTPGSLCFLLERPGLRALFAGDVIQHLNPELPNALGTSAAYLSPRFRGDVRDYLSSLRRLRKLPVPDLVLPGHPQMDPVPQSPRLSAERWQTFLDGGIREMERLTARYEADGSGFLDGSPRELLPGLHYFGDLGGSAVYCLATPKDLFVVNAPGGAALVGFLAARFEASGWKGRKPTAVLLTSVEEQSIAGLKSLAETSGCQVVAPKAGLAEVGRLCPAGTKLLAAEEIEKAAWFDVRGIPLAGRGLDSVAYLLRWAGKTVLISGPIPVKSSNEGMSEGLRREVGKADGAADRYVESLEKLGKVKPDLWLPAVPTYGQNAYLYDRDWADVLKRNRQLFR